MNENQSNSLLSPSEAALLEAAREDPRFLLVLPALYVGWAGGTMSAPTRIRLLEMATRVGMHDDALRHLREVLAIAPGKEFFEQGLEDLGVLQSCVMEEQASSDSGTSNPHGPASSRGRDDGYGPTALRRYRQLVRRSREYDPSYERGGLV